MGGYTTDQKPYEPPASAVDYGSDPANAPGWLEAIGGFAKTPAASTFNIGRQAEEVQETADPSQKLAEQYAAAGVNDPAIFQGLAKEPKPDLGPAIPKDKLDEQYAPPGEHWFDQDMPDAVAQIIARQKRENAERMQAWNRFTDAHSWPVNFAASTAAFLMDPLQAMTLFVPGVGEETALAAAGRIGLRGALERYGARAIAGATGATAGIIPLEVLRATRDPDFSLRQSFSDLAFNAALGAALHMGMGVPGELGWTKGDETLEAYRRRKEKELGAPPAQAETPPVISPEATPEAPPDPNIGAKVQAIQNAGPDAQHAAIGTAVSQIVHGDEIDVSPIIYDRESLARSMDPQTFKAWDALRDTADRLRGWLDDLKGPRTAGVAASPNAEEIRRIEAQIDVIRSKVPTEAKLTKKARARIEALQDQRNELLARQEEAGRTDTPDMRKIRERIMATDEQLRDLAAKVSAIYRQADAAMNSPLGAALGYGADGPRGASPAQIVERRKELAKEGVTPGKTQDQVRAENEAIYGTRTADRTGKRGAADRAQQGGGGLGGREETPGPRGAQPQGQPAAGGVNRPPAAAPAPAGPPAAAAQGAPVAGGAPAVPSAGAPTGEAANAPQPFQPPLTAPAENPDVQAHGREAGAQLVHDKTIQEILARPDVKAAMQRPRAIVRTHQIPYLAGSNNEGGVTFIDRLVPKLMQIGNRIVDPAKYLNVHEQVEHALMVLAGMPYETAHRVATDLERAAVEADGVEWPLYQKAMDDLAKKTEAEHVGPDLDIPTDLYLKPYTPTEQARMKDLQRAKENLPAIMPDRPEAPPPVTPTEPQPAARSISTMPVEPGQFTLQPNVPVALQARDYVWESGRSDGHEHIVAVDKDGNVLGVGKGGKGKVGVAPDLAKALYDPKAEIVVHHNHPEGASFSDQDIAMLSRPGLKAVWAHGHNGLSFRAELTPEATPLIKTENGGDAGFDKIKQIGRSTDRMLHKILKPMIEAGEITARQAYEIHAHAQNEILRRAGIIDYEVRGLFVPDLAKIEDKLKPQVKKAREIVFGKGAPDVALDRPAQPLQHPGDVGIPPGASKEPPPIAGEEPGDQVGAEHAEAEAGRAEPPIVVVPPPRPPRGPAARPIEKWSLLEYLAGKRKYGGVGGLKPDPELDYIFGGKNPFIPGFGRLFREDGMPLDYARRRAAEGHYLHDESTPADLLNLIAEEAAGRKQYRWGELGPEAKAPRESDVARHGAISADLDKELLGVHIDPATIDPRIRERVIEIVDKEGELDPLTAYERASMEIEHESAEQGIIPQIPDFIPGWDVPHDSGPAPAPGAPPTGIRRFEVPESGGPSREAGGGAGGPAAEPGAEGKPQLLIPGVEPVTERQKLEAQANAPMRGGAAAMPAGGIFDDLARQQMDLIDQIQKGEQALQGVDLTADEHKTIAATDAAIAQANREAEAITQAGECISDGDIPF